MIFLLQSREAKILYTQGRKQGGVPSRQNGESMMSYISCRKGWWITLQELDKSKVISENIRADLLLDLANISDTEKLMIKTSCGNKSDCDLIATALLDQHPNIETRERRSARTEESRHGKGYHPGWGARNHSRNLRIMHTCPSMTLKWHQMIHSKLTL